MFTKHSPYDFFSDFIAPCADRYKILLECIKSLKYNCAVIPVAGNRHIFIFPPGQKTLRSAGVFPFRKESPFILCAHYDRVEGSPGANDNSIAVFHLLKTASFLTQQKTEKWMVVFTDKEELAPGESLEAQGSFTLAEKLKTWGLEKAKIYNFDACGAGNTFIISTTTDHILKNSSLPNIHRIRKSILSLRDHALATANNMRLDKVLLAPTPFSDDVGFLRAGLAAQTITMLPSDEAQQYEALLRSRPEYADLIISGKIKEPQEYRHLPDTWRSLNNAKDTPSRLTPQFFEQVVNFTVELIRKQ
ncbi:MAG: M28 family metallopeptidase [Treponema sp.]|nr:M28 family metallopeptidase [Treponema sp.]